MSFDPIYLHDVVPYNKGGNMPAPPDWRDLQKSLTSIVSALRGEDLTTALSLAEDLQYRFDHGNEIEEYMDKSYELISHLHGAIRDTYDALQQWDPHEYNEEETERLVEEVSSSLGRGLPSSKYLGDMSSTSWFNFEVTRLISGYPELKSLFMEYMLDDIYLGTFGDVREKYCKLLVSGNGSLRIELHDVKAGTGSVLTFSSGGEVVTKGPKDTSVFKISLSEFKGFFVEWWRPTKEEVSLFQMMYPGSNFDVLLFFKDKLPKP